MGSTAPLRVLSESGECLHCLPANVPIREKRVVSLAGILKRHIWQDTNLSLLGIVRVYRLSSRGVWNPLAAGTPRSSCHAQSRREERDEERNVTTCSVSRTNQGAMERGEGSNFIGRVWNVKSVLSSHPRRFWLRFPGNWKEMGAQIQMRLD